MLASRRAIDLGEVLAAGGKHQALMASHAGLDSEAELFQFPAHVQREAAFAGLDQDSNGCRDAQGWRDLRQRRLEFGKRIPDRDEADAVPVKKRPKPDNDLFRGLPSRKAQGE